MLRDRHQLDVGKPHVARILRQGLGNLGPVKACDAIDWTLFGLSMATYNVGVSLVLAIGCFRAAGLWQKDIRT